ncbi:MAG: formylglycine-generating enzyme family protein, partial [Planctomycetota bacterium]
ISKPYYIGKYAVTVAQFRRFAETAKYETDCERGGNKGWTVKDGKWQGDVAGINWKQPGFEQTAEHPVVLVTWNDAQAFCKWAGDVEQASGLRTQSGGLRHIVRLPTEAEWEYAARGPGSPKYPWGDKWDGTKANHGDVSLKNTGFTAWGCTSDNDGYAYTSPVGVYKNASWCGACDMAGNVWQWCADWFNDKYYQELPSLDPKGPPNGGERVLRGGALNNDPGNCRAARRLRSDPGYRDACFGFRCALDF